MLPEYSYKYQIINHTNFTAGTKMASLQNSINPLFFMQILLSLIPLFTADENLVQTQCHHTETPQLCMQCIKSADPQGKNTTDEIGIAITVTTCLRNFSEQLAGTMKELASQAKDGKLRAAYVICSKGYANSLTDLAKVESSLKSKDFDEANRSVVLAMQIQAGCLEKLKGEVPDIAVYDMKGFEFLSEGVMRMIDRF